MIKLVRDGALLTIKYGPLTIVLGLTGEHLYATCGVAVRYRRKKT